MERFYNVKAKCGHVGQNKFIPIEFAVCAESGKEAARITRYFPRVKHHQKDAILDVREITQDEYRFLRHQNGTDPYLHCRNIQEQRMFGTIYDRIVEENRIIQKKENKSERVYFIGKEQVRNVKKYTKGLENVRISKVRDSLQAA